MKLTGKFSARTMRGFGGRKKMRISSFYYILLLVVAVAANAIAAEQQEAIDWNRAREIYQRSRAGETVTPEEKTYLQNAMRQREQMKGAAQTQQSQQTGKPTVGLKPLTDLGAATYKGEDSGLYGGGRNEPPSALADAAKRAAAKIRPLDAQGKPSKDGKIVLVSIGMSNTTQEFSRFVPLANQSGQKSPDVVLVDGAQGGKDAAAWNNSEGPWQVLDQRLRSSSATAEQVQAAWLKQALIQPSRLGEFPAHAKKLEEDIGKIVVKLRERFPNLRIVYLSSRIYAGYAVTQLNPEPYAYESAFAVRRLIQKQKSDGPVLLWGPYLWGDGTTARAGDGLTWERGDFGQDGTHPSDSGRLKVAEMLLKFFTTDPTARAWFAK